MLNGLVVGLYRYQQAYEMGPAIVYVGTSLVMALGLWMVGLVLGVDNQRRIAENAVSDYLENYLKSKLDGEYGYGRQVEEPDNYERALRETAAARTAPARHSVGMSPEYNRRTAGRTVNRPMREDKNADAVDAKIVEDVLKEFLC